jgi:hypothetical protein
MFKRKTPLFLVLLVVISASSFYFYYFGLRQLIGTPPVTTVATSTENARGAKVNSCLGDNEIADYKIDQNPLGGGLVFISIKDKTTNTEIRDLQVPILGTGYAHPIELHKCGIYALRTFNYDYKRDKFLPGYSPEIWKYDYSGNGSKLIALGGIDLTGKEEPVQFGFNFNVSTDETYIALTRGHLGGQDYAVVVKDLKTLNDALTLTQVDLVNKYEIPPYEIGAGRWLDDNTFLVFVTDGAVSYDEIVVHKGEENNWKLTVLPVPDDASVVTAWNPDGYWIAYNNGPGWIGVEDVAQEIYKQWRAEGKTQSLFVYNLATKQKITLASKIDPAWSFKTKWISTTTLQYTLPSSATTTYTIPQ